MSVSAQKQLLVTTTGEPYQSVRLRWTVPSKAYCIQRLEALECVGVDGESKLLTIWHMAEAKALKLGAQQGLPASPPSASDGRIVILGTFRFPDAHSMVLEVRSIPRASEIARLLRPLLGPRAELTRVRVVNRWFAASELAAGLPALDRWLDRDVTIVRWEETADEVDALLERGATPEERQALWLEWHAVRRKVDVALVEDFPCHPEDEDEEMSDLAATLHFRLLRAGRHWAGEMVTLADVIEEVVARGFAPPGPPRR
jgi:hypothetical protein